jgi:ribosomal protein L11 methyltransferase
VDEPPGAADLLAALLDEFAPSAIEDLAPMPLPPGGLWDPTFPPIPEPPPAPLHWRVFFDAAATRDRARQAIAAALPALRLENLEVPDEDWAARSQRSLTAVRAGRFIVAPPWDQATLEGATTIIIEPSMGFGTGHHATTRLCLKLLSDTPVRGLEVLDIGTGSGVLAMAAALTGARSVLGLDVDRDAIQSAEHSATLNPLPKTITFRVGDFRLPPPVGPADVVMANLTGGMLTSAAALLVATLRAGGTLIVSGFDVSEVDAVRAALAALHEEARLEEDAWVALRLRRL